MGGMLLIYALFHKSNRRFTAIFARFTPLRGYPAYSAASPA